MEEKKLDNFETVEVQDEPTVPHGAVAEISLKTLVSSNLRQYGIVGALLAIVVIFQITTGGLLLLPNSFVALIQQNAYVILLAIGMVMVIVATHIDLSVGSQIAFIGAICAIMMERMGVPWYIAIFACLATGIAVGAWHGFWIAYVGIPGFITTLSGMLLFRGLSTVMVGESLPIKSASFRDIAKVYVPSFLGFVGPFDVLTLVVGAIVIVALVWSTFRKFSNSAKAGIVIPRSAKSWSVMVLAFEAILVVGVTYLLASSGNTSAEGVRFGGIPLTLVIIAVPVGIYTFLTTKTVFGRYVYAVGGNRKAAILSGINTKAVDFKIYLHMGFLTAIAAVYMLSRSASATAVAGNGFELDAIAACFIGGTAVTGGVGTVPGVVIGALVMGVLNQGLSLMGVSQAWVQAIKGLVLLAAVAIDLVSKRKSS